MSIAIEDDVEVLRMRIQNVELERDFAVKTAEQLKARNATLGSKVRTLERERDAAHMEAQELRWQKLHAEADSSLQASVHRDARVEWGSKMAAMQDRLSSQVQDMTSKAARVISSLIAPSSRASSRRASHSGAASDGAEGEASAATAAFVAQLGTDSEDVQQQVQQLLLGYMSGTVNEEDTLQQLSSLRCTLSIESAAFAAKLAEAVPAHETAAAGPAVVVDSSAACGVAATPAPEAGAAAVHSAAAPSWTHFTSFVLAEPEKLHRLMARANSLGGATASGGPALTASTASGTTALSIPVRSHSVRAPDVRTPSGSEGGAGDAEVLLRLPSMGAGEHGDKGSNTGASSGAWKALDSVSSWGSKLVNSWSTASGISGASSATATKPSIAAGPGLPKPPASSSGSAKPVSLSQSGSGPSITFGGSKAAVGGSAGNAAATFTHVAASFVPVGKQHAGEAGGAFGGSGRSAKDGPEFLSGGREVSLYSATA